MFQLKEIGIYRTPKDIAELMVKIGETFNPKTILDPACGLGTILSYCNFGDKIIGMDINQKVIEYCREKYDNIEFRQFDFLTADLIAKFDLIISNFPCGKVQFQGENEYLEKMFFEKSLSLLNDGGLIICIVPNRFLFSKHCLDIREKVLAKYYLKMVITIDIASGSMSPSSIIVVQNCKILDTLESKNRTFMGFYSGEIDETIKNIVSIEGNYWIIRNKIQDQWTHHYIIEAFKNILFERKSETLFDKKEHPLYLAPELRSIKDKKIKFGEDEWLELIESVPTHILEEKVNERKLKSPHTPRITIKDKKKLSELLGDFYRHLNEPGSNIRKDYNEKFEDGGKKAKDVIKFIQTIPREKDLGLSKLAYVSIGGADGAEILNILKFTPVPKGILLEYDFDLCRKAEQESVNFKLQDRLKILPGDAWENKGSCNEILQEWMRSGEIKGVIISCFSVLHEMKFRAGNRLAPYSHFEFFRDLIENIPEIYFFSREPTRFMEWEPNLHKNGTSGMVNLSILNWLTRDELFKFAETIQERLGGVNDDYFNRKIKKVLNHITLDVQLAAEVLKKFLYFLKDSSVNNLLYELEESHVAFNPERFSEILGLIFGENVSFRYTTSDSFKDLYQEANIKIESIDGTFKKGQIPNVFAEFMGWYYPPNEDALV